MSRPRLYWSNWLHQAPDERGLSQAEQAHYQTMPSAGRRLEYAMSRRLLRRALAEEIGPAARTVALAASGPPTLPAEYRLFTALSHSKSHALCGVHPYPIGVDMEPRDRCPDWRGLAQRWFTDDEVSYLSAQPPERAREHFLLLWTLKEAWLKANHLGIAGNLQRLQLTGPAYNLKPAEWAITVPADGHSWQLASTLYQGFWLTAIWQEKHSDAPPILHQARNDEPLLQAENVPWLIHTHLKPR